MTYINIIKMNGKTCMIISLNTLKHLEKKNDTIMIKPFLKLKIENNFPSYEM